MFLDILVREDYVLFDGEVEEEVNLEKLDLVLEILEVIFLDVVVFIMLWGILFLRFKFILIIVFVFVICNMDKVSCYFFILFLIILVLLDV